MMIVLFCDGTEHDGEEAGFLKKLPYAGSGRIRFEGFNLSTDFCLDSTNSSRTTMTGAPLAVILQSIRFCVGIQVSFYGQFAGKYRPVWGLPVEIAMRMVLLELKAGL